jgi:hypothetical protein
MMCDTMMTCDGDTVVLCDFVGIGMHSKHFDVQ